MIKFLKYFAVLINTILVGYFIEEGLPSSFSPRIDFWVVVSILMVALYGLYFSLIQIVMAGRNLLSVWINRKKAEQWVQIKELSSDENVTLTVGKFGYFITILILLIIIGQGAIYLNSYYKQYTEIVVVEAGESERTDEEAMLLYEEALESKKKGSPFWDNMDPKPEDYKKIVICEARGFKVEDLIPFAVIGLYGLSNLSVIFGFLTDKRRPNLFRLIMERKRLEEEAKLRDLNA